MKKLIFIAVALLLLSSCTSEPRARKVLEDNGYTNVQITGYRWFMCGKDDTYATGFVATAPVTKKQVSGAVCEGFFKGETIRFD